MVRGAIAERRRKGFFQNETMSTARQVRTNLRRVLLQTRAAIDSAHYGAFLEWFTAISRLEFPNGIEDDVGFDYLNGVIKGPPVSLAHEISWLTTRFQFESDAINDFRIRAEALERHALNGRYSDAIDYLAAINSVHGETMWSVQLRLALEQKSGGLEAQKAYFESVRGKYKRGILEYVAYQTSLRNEERASWTRFSDAIGNANLASKDREIGDYLDYRLRNKWPATSSAICNVIRIEQSHSVLDQYETFVSFCQEVVRRTDLVHLRPEVGRAVEALGEISDFRLRKIQNTISDFPTDFPSTIEELGGTHDDGDFSGLALKTRNSLSQNKNTWESLYHEVLMASEDKAEPKSASGLFSPFLRRFIHSRGDTANDAHELEKLCHNFNALSFGRAALALVRAIYPAESDQEFNFRLVGLHSPAESLEDSKGILPFLRASRNNRAEKLADALSAFYRVEPEAALEAIRLLPQVDGRDVISRFADLIALHCANHVGDQETVITTLSKLGAHDPSQIAVLPVAEMLESLPVSVYKRLSPSLASLNALNMLWKATESDKAASTLRLMTGTFLRRSDIGKPSSLIEQLDHFDRAELIYFLREVCVPSVLDVSRIFASSQDVLEERQAICGVLNTLDPGRTADYSEEVLAITRRLKVDEGLRLVDQSRVHVDTDAVTRWAHKELSEDFDRYNDLAQAGIGATGNFDDALREIREAIKHTKQGEFFTPQNEADTALVRLLRALREEFLNSSSYGLDYFLSKRIRHVSFIGLVRGPLEFAHLIATRPTATSDYGRNMHWLERLTTLAQHELQQVDEAIRAFSLKFDSALNRLKGEVLHVRSEERPGGIFDIPISMALLAIGRAILRDNQSFDDFLRSVYIIFWAALQPSLLQARQLINDELKMQIAHDIDELKAGIAKFAQHDPAFPELSASLAHASSEVQAALSEASSWFTRPEIREVTRHFALEEALDVAIESALKLHRAFTPEIEIDVTGDVSLAAPDLIFITDAVLVAFSNIKAYSKLDRPKVKITLQLDEESEVLVVRIENNVSPKARSAQQDRRINDIRAVIESGVTDRRAKTEGGSGFIKLAAVVQQSTRGRIEFGYIEEHRFCLTVAYSIILDPKLDLVAA